MTQRRIRAVFMRGGTGRAIFFHHADLPPAGAARDRILLAALGSPDPYGRQLDGLGGGISSLSKACIIGPATHPDADVDYTFAQVHVAKPIWSSCGRRISGSRAPSGQKRWTPTGRSRRASRRSAAPLPT